MIKIALFGCGRIGMIHLANILQHESLNLAGISDPHHPQVDQISRRWRVPILTERQIFENPSINAVLIASPSNTHISLIEAGLVAGKHMLCEKPLDLDLERVRAIAGKIDASSVTFSLGFNRRFDASIDGLQQKLQAGSVGRLENLTIISRDPAPPPLEYLKASGGMFRDMTIHDFDLARWLVGTEMKRIYARGKVTTGKEIEEAEDIDQGVVHLESLDGVFIQIINSRRAVYGYDQRVEAFGSKGMLRVENHLESSLQHYGVRLELERPVHFFLERYKQSYRNELDQFVQTILNQTSPRANHWDGVRALELAEAALVSLKTGKPVDL